MKRHFSCIELVIVSVCSALLLTCAIGSATLSKEKADLAKCTANQKGMYELMQKYLSRNDDYYPQAYEPTKGKYWFGAIGDLNNIDLWGKTAAEKPSIFTCPAVEACYATDGTQQNGGIRFAVNYAYNSNLAESKIDVGISAELTSPSKVLMFADAPVIQDSKCTPKQTFYCITDTSVINPRYGKLSPGFGAHGKDANICWADGHVSAAASVVRENIHPAWN